MCVLPHVPGGPRTMPLAFEVAGATQNAANALDSTGRRLLHARCKPALLGELDGKAAQGGAVQAGSLQLHPLHSARGTAGFYLDDACFGTPLIERVRTRGEIVVLRRLQRGVP